MDFKHYTDLPKELQNCTRTELQWALAGFVPKEFDSGMILWTNRYHAVKKRYLTEDQVRPGTAEELKAFASLRSKHDDQEHRFVVHGLNAQIERLEQQQAETMARLIQVEADAKSQLRGAIEAYRGLLRRLLEEQPAGEKERRSGIVLDIETTGLDADYDEVLQVPVIDAGSGNTLLNTYVRPVWTFRWEEAQQINGISLEMVADAPTMDKVMPQLNAIIQGAREIIGYGVSFDLLFLKQYGIEFGHQKIVDVMLEFAPLYGEWSDQYEDYKWQSLSKCAAFFGYDWGENKAHDSLADCKATLFCHNCIKKMDPK